MPWKGNGLPTMSSLTNTWRNTKKHFVIS
jgi:hypothetical protein